MLSINVKNAVKIYGLKNLNALDGKNGYLRKMVKDILKTNVILQGEAMMDINEMTREEFEKLPYRKNWQEEVICDSLIILPARINIINIIVWNLRKLLSHYIKWIKSPEIYEMDGMHDSGYRCMDFIAVKDSKPICRLSGCSDVIHFDGIGGHGYKWLEKYGKCPDKIQPSDWSIDCLVTSGLLRIFSGGKIICGASLSSFEIYRERQ